VSSLVCILLEGRWVSQEKICEVIPTLANQLFPLPIIQISKLLRPSELQVWHSFELLQFVLASALLDEAEDANVWVAFGYGLNLLEKEAVILSPIRVIVQNSIIDGSRCYNSLNFSERDTSHLEEDGFEVDFLLALVQLHHEVAIFEGRFLGNRKRSHEDLVQDFHASSGQTLAFIEDVERDQTLELLKDEERLLPGVHPAVCGIREVESRVDRHRHEN